jgi:hypothetical protein
VLDCRRRGRRNLTAIQHEGCAEALRAAFPSSRTAKSDGNPARRVYRSAPCWIPVVADGEIRRQSSTTGAPKRSVLDPRRFMAPYGARMARRPPLLRHSACGTARWTNAARTKPHPPSLQALGRGPTEDMRRRICDGGSATEDLRRRICDGGSAAIFGATSASLRPAPASPAAALWTTLPAAVDKRPSPVGNRPARVDKAYVGCELKVLQSAISRPRCGLPRGRPFNLSTFWCRCRKVSCGNHLR